MKLIEVCETVSRFLESFGSASGCEALPNISRSDLSQDRLSSPTSWFSWAGCERYVVGVVWTLLDALFSLSSRHVSVLLQLYMCGVNSWEQCFYYGVILLHLWLLLYCGIFCDMCFCDFVVSSLVQNREGNKSVWVYCRIWVIVAVLSSLWLKPKLNWQSFPLFGCLGWRPHTDVIG